MRTIEGKRIINPKMTSEKLHLELGKTYLLLDKMAEVEPVAESYGIYCEQCKKWNQKMYPSYRKVPGEVFCNICKKELSVEEDLYVIFSE